MVVVVEVQGEVMVDARLIKVFGKDVPIRKYGCRRFDMDEPLYFDIPRVNLFIQTTNLCNANCKFCIYHSCEKKVFNVKKFEEVIKELVNPNYNIGKLNFTGGEPTLDASLYSELSSIVRDNLDYSRKPEVTLNTNGYNLDVVLKNQDILDSIGFSRHHFDDELNFDIFQTRKIPNEDEIKSFVDSLSNRNIFQLRCNLIKDYIDDYDSITKYMDWAISVGVRDCGFVTLAPNNDFCKNHQIDFANLVRLSKDLIKVCSFTRVDDEDLKTEYCQCANYVYSNPNGEMCKFYSRLFCRNDIKEGMLVFDGENLRYGFGGEIIY